MFRGLLLGVLLALASQVTPVNAHPQVMSYDAWRAVKYFPPDQQVTALKIFYCESQWNTYAIGSAGERGIPQIHPIHFDYYKVTGDQLTYNPELAGIVAYFIYIEQGWSAWSCYK